MESKELQSGIVENCIMVFIVLAWELKVENKNVDQVKNTKQGKLCKTEFVTEVCFMFNTTDVNCDLYKLIQGGLKCSQWKSLYRIHHHHHSTTV